MRKKIFCPFFIFTLFILASTSFAGILEELNHGADRNNHRALDDSWSATSSDHWDYWDTLLFTREKHEHGDHDYDHDGDHDHDYDHDGDHDHDYDHDGDHDHDYDHDGDDQGDHNGGTPPVAPEPASSILFLTGSAIFAYRRFMKRG